MSLVFRSMSPSVSFSSLDIFATSSPCCTMVLCKPRPPTPRIFRVLCVLLGAVFRYVIFALFKVTPPPLAATKFAQLKVATNPYCFGANSRPWLANPHLPHRLRETSQASLCAYSAGKIQNAFPKHHEI